MSQMQKNGIRGTAGNCSHYQLIPIEESNVFIGILSERHNCSDNHNNCSCDPHNTVKNLQKLILAIRSNN